MGQKVSTLGDVFSWKNGGGDSSAKNGGDSSAKNGDAPVVQCDCCATVVGPASTADAAQAPEQSAENIYDADPQPSSSSRPPDVVCAEHAKCCDNAASSSSANKNSAQSSSKSASGSKKHWVLRFNCSRPKSKNAAKCCAAPAPETVPETDRVECDACVCTRYQRTEDQQPSGAAAAAAAAPSFELNEPLKLLPIVRFVRPDFDDDDDDDYDDRHRHDMDGRDDDDDLSSMPLEFDGTFDAFAAFNHRHSDLVLPSFDDAFPMDLNSDMSADEYINEDFEDRAYRERAKEIQEGIDPPPGFRPGVIELLELGWPKRTLDNLTTLFNYRATLSAMSPPNGMDDSHRIHTSIDYIHYLVPDLLQITNCSFYWGKMDRYEAEKLLENRPEGTFLLRDSAQEEYLFSVSFRKYGRSLHARIEQWNHLFSFDSRDPGVFASSTVCGLIEHYKDPSCCMFFEPMLTIPFPRNFTFSLMHTCRATICSQITYDDVNQLALPKTLKSYLKEYHYKQRVRIRQFDCEN